MPTSKIKLRMLTTRQKTTSKLAFTLRIYKPTAAFEKKGKHFLKATIPEVRHRIFRDVAYRWHKKHDACHSLRNMRAYGNSEKTKTCTHSSDSLETIPDDWKIENHVPQIRRFRSLESGDCTIAVRFVTTTERAQISLHI